MLPIGPPELALVLFLAVLLFGANKLPKLGHSLGRATKEFKAGQQASEQELEELRENDT